jgi:hypothetical protein
MSSIYINPSRSKCQANIDYSSILAQSIEQSIHSEKVASKVVRAARRADKEGRVASREMLEVHAKDVVKGKGKRKKGKNPSKEIEIGDVHSLALALISPSFEGTFTVDRNKMTSDFNGRESITIAQNVDTEFTTDKECGEDYELHQQSRTPISGQVSSINPLSIKMLYTYHDCVNIGRAKAGLEPAPTPTTGYLGADYLRDVGGVSVKIREARAGEIHLRQLKKCTFVMVAHFATAELNIVFSGSLKAEIKLLQRSEGESQILSGRRLQCQGKHKTDIISLNHIVTVDGVDFEMCLKIIDTGAIHGIASYAGIAEAVGHDLPFKNLFNSDQKSRMIDMAVERAQDFQDYALGDLDVYEIIEKNKVKFKEVYELVGLGDYYRNPKLTIGGTVKDLFEASLAHFFGIKGDKWVEQLKVAIDSFIHPASSDALRKWVNFTRAILSKVEGGRCRNNRPIDMSVKSSFKLKETQLSRRNELIGLLKLYDTPVCDIDISSCYGEGQRNQDYPIGNPEYFDYVNSGNNEYISLRAWLKAYDVDIDALRETAKRKDFSVWYNQDFCGELVSGLWMARVSTFKDLKYSQDFVASWFMDSSHGVEMLAKFLAEMKCDTELATTENVVFDEDIGSLKIFNNSIKNGVITHDFLQWLFAIATPRQCNEMLDNIKILSSMVYPASQRIKPENGALGLEMLAKAKSEWVEKNTTHRIKEVSRSSTIQMNFRECHAWFSVNLGTLLVDKLLIERKKAKIECGAKSPLDILFKLCVNTLYGDMVSKFFVTSNPVVGNNITARARALAWYMEKGLHGQQPITDGCAFTMNNVLFPGRDMISGESVNLHRENSTLSRRKIKTGSLGGVGKLSVQWLNEKPYLISDEETVIENSLEWIAKVAMEHLQNLFPMVDVLHKESESLDLDKKTKVVTRSKRVGQFTFEVKDIFHSGCFHGSANYALENPNGLMFKARGYETKREHLGVEIDTESDVVEFTLSDRYGTKNNPAKDFLTQVLENPESVKRQIPAIKSGILKVGEYKNASKRFDDVGIEPGDNILKSVLMQEFSLSQFTFQNHDQYVSWKKTVEKAKDKQKQSLEGYFLNEDSSLNLKALAVWVDDAIARGVMNPFAELKDANRNDTRTIKRFENKPSKTDERGAKLGKIVSLSHPSLEALKALKKSLNTPIETISETVTTQIEVYVETDTFNPELPVTRSVESFETLTFETYTVYVPAAEETYTVYVPAAEES